MRVGAADDGGDVCDGGTAWMTRSAAFRDLEQEGQIRLPTFNRLIKSPISRQISYLHQFKPSGAIILLEFGDYPLGFLDITHGASHTVAGGEGLGSNVGGDEAVDTCYEDER